MEQNGGCCLQLAASGTGEKPLAIEAEEEAKDPFAVTDNPQFLQILQPLCLLESQKVKILEGFLDGAGLKSLGRMEDAIKGSP
jgi:hypothetical protein